MDYHCTELDKDDEGIHSQEEDLKGLSGKVVLSKLRKLQRVEQDYPHNVDEEKCDKCVIAQNLQCLLRFSI